MTASVVYHVPLGVEANAAPDDDDIVAGQLFIWFDKTNGSSKIMFKAKQADGSVKTGSVSLS